MPHYFPLIGGLAGFGLFYLIALFSEFLFKKPALGGGDIKLAGMLGIYVGWDGILITLFIASLIGIGYAGIVYTKNRVKPQKIPFGSILTLAGIIAK